MRGAIRSAIRGVILAGGTGSRLDPLTRVTNKHLLPVGREPMIYHPIRKLVSAGVSEILAVTGTEHAGDVYRLLGSGSEFAVRFTFRVQDKPGGIAQALGLARDFVGGHPFVALLGDNVFEDDFSPLVARWGEAWAQHTGPRGMVLLAEVEDAHRFGVARFDQDRLVEIVEKPAAGQEPSRWAVTGAYFYAGGPLLFDLVDRLEPSDRGEVEITDLNNALIAERALAYVKLAGRWSDAGSHETLRRASEIVEAR